VFYLSNLFDGMDIRKKIVAIFLICLTLFYMITAVSCGPARDLRKAQRLIERAKSKGAFVEIDTLYKQITIRVPPVHVEWEPKPIPIGRDTVYYESKTKSGGGNIITKVVVNQNRDSIVYLSTDCPEQIVIQKVPVAVNQTIKAGRSTWDIVILCLVCLVIGFVSGRFWR
jgi:hypothetical protein